MVTTNYGEMTDDALNYEITTRFSGPWTADSAGRFTKPHNWLSDGAMTWWALCELPYPALEKQDRKRGDDTVTLWFIAWDSNGDDYSVPLKYGSDANPARAVWLAWLAYRDERKANGVDDDQY